MARAAAERAIAGGDGSGTNIPLRTRRHIVRAAEEAELKRLFRTRHVLSCVSTHLAREKCERQKLTVHARIFFFQ